MRNTIKISSFPTQIRALLFDYDGVLVDSMGENYVAWKYAFNIYHAAINEQIFYPLEGMSPMGIVESLGTIVGVPGKHFGAIVAAKEEYYRIHHTLRLIAPVVETIKRAKDNGIRVGLVSGGLLPRIQEATPKRILDLFDVIVTSDMVTHTKPDKEPYEKALALLHVKAREAVALENAPLGIVSAKAAGLYCIAIPTTVPCEKLKHADVCVRDISRLPDMMVPKQGN